MDITHTQLLIVTKALRDYFCGEEGETLEGVYTLLGSLEKDLIDRIMKETGKTLKELQTL